MNTSEQSLVERFKRGDENAFDELYKLLGRRIYRFALRLTGSKEDAEDITVQTFTEAHRCRDRLKAESTLSAWLFRVAVNTAHRQRRRRLRTSKLIAEVEDTATAKYFERVELVELVLFLPENLRVPFLLVKLEGLTYVEAAQVLGKRPGTIQAQVHEASRRVRAKLGPQVPNTKELLSAEGNP